MRRREAEVLRRSTRDSRPTAANIGVLGDLNDTKDSPSTRTVIGRGRRPLIDTRVADDDKGFKLFNYGIRATCMDAFLGWKYYSRVDCYLCSIPTRARNG